MSRRRDVTDHRNETGEQDVGDAASTVRAAYDPLNFGYCTRCGDLACRCDAHQEASDG